MELEQVDGYHRHMTCARAPLRAGHLDPLSALLVRLARLLDRAQEQRWAQSMWQLADAAAAASGTQERQEVVRRVLALYGGMGSFNDVVLQDERGVMPEQVELDELRSRLFETARE